MVFKVSFWWYIIERWIQIMTLIWPRSRCFKKISGMQCVQKYLIISTCIQHILTHNLLPLEKEKSQMIGYRPFSTKMIPFHQRKFGKVSWVWEQKSAWKDMLTYSQTPGGPLPVKRIFSSDQTLAKERCQFRQLWGMSLACKRKEPEN